VSPGPYKSVAAKVARIKTKFASTIARPKNPLFMYVVKVFFIMWRDGLRLSPLLFRRAKPRAWNIRRWQ